MVSPAVPVRKRHFRSLAAKFSLFTAGLVFWVVATLVFFDLQGRPVEWYKWAGMSGLVIVVAAGVSRFTITLLARPLTLLEQGIKSVAEGRPEPVQVSRTGDEIERLGESFNKMIARLIASQNEMRQQQESLAAKVRERTAELECEMKKTEAASRARSEIVASLSHQLRTTMNGLLGMIDLVQQSQITAEQRDQLESAVKCARSLQSMLDSILDISELEAGRMSLQPSVFELRPLLEEAVESHKTSAAAKGIALTLEIAADVPPRMKADPRRLHQVLSHLVTNAVKFTQAGWVKVRVQREPARDGFAILTEIIDTGIGMAADKLSEILDPAAPHSGIGLPVAKRLVELHGGEFSIQSQPTVGTTVRCTIPSAHVEEVAFSHQLIAAAAAVASMPILIVEDNYINQKVVTGMLRKRGYQVDVANHGQEALDRLEAQRYGLILMDVQMPVLDGLETTRRIKRDPRFQSIPIVAMTALAMEGDRERCLAAGMDAYVSKPLNTSTLLRVVEEQLVA